MRPQAPQNVFPFEREVIPKEGKTNLETHFQFFFSFFPPQYKY